MRKILLTGAVVLVGGGAYAMDGVSVSGGAVFGVKFTEDATDEITFHHEFDISFSASGTTDGGLGFGASAGFDSEPGSNDVDLGTVYVSMDNHTLTIGDNDAADLVAGGIKDVGFDDIGADDAPEALNGNSKADLIYTGSFGPASVGISAGPEDGDDGYEYAAGFNFNIAPVKVGVGFDSGRVISIGMGISQGAISGNVLYSTTKKHMVDVYPDALTDVDAADSERSEELAVKSTALGADVSYQLSEGTSVTMVYGQHKVDGYDEAVGDTDDGDIAANTMKSMGIGFAHDLGGGATLKAGAGKNTDEKTVADLGITMSF
ncbi:MAG: porin [Rhodobacteraceae bacterium]|nr:porin [Paracoccaceae bacterium]